MLGELIRLDLSLFFAINRGLENTLFDTLLPWCRTPLFWSPLYLFILVFAMMNFGQKKYWVFLLGLVLSVGLTDMASSHLIKKKVERLRPCNSALVKDYVDLRVDRCGSGFSFTSSHAANHFAAARFIGFFFAPTCGRWATPALYFWAALISFSQIYVGLHYPLDVLGGATLGLIMASLVLLLIQKTGLNIAKIPPADH